LNERISLNQKDNNQGENFNLVTTLANSQPANNDDDKKEKKSYLTLNNFKCFQRTLIIIDKTIH